MLDRNYRRFRFPAIDGSSGSLVAVNPLDSTFSRASVGSNAGIDYERSSSPKTSRHFSFEQPQLVSPPKMMGKRGPEVWGNWGGKGARDDR